MFYKIFCFTDRGSKRVYSLCNTNIVFYVSIHCYWFCLFKAKLSFE